MKSDVSRFLIFFINILGFILLLNFFFDSFSILGSYNNLLILLFVICIISLPLIQNRSNLDRILSLIGLILVISSTFFNQFSYLAIIVLFYIIFKYIISTYDKDDEEEIKKKHKNLNLKSKFNEVLSLSLSFINPFQLFQQIILFLGELILSFKKTYVSKEDYKQKTDFNLPFRGEWFVANGGFTKKTSHSWNLKTQRFAYDFIKVDNEQKSHNSSGKELKDYYCYSEPILSPADGKVIKVHDGISDHKNPGNMKIDFLARDFRGNFVIIKHQDDEYSLLAHLIPGSIKVKEGENIKKGKKIGKCGNSGHSTEPHLHFQVQNHPNFFLGNSLPIKFSNLKVNQEFYKSFYINKGYKVENNN